MGAEAFAIVLGVVLLFDWGVGFSAVVAWGAFLVFFDEGADGSGVEIAGSSAILFVMVVDAHFVVVLEGDVAWVDFEDVEVELLNGETGYLDDGRGGELVASLAGVGVISEMLWLFP